MLSLSCATKATHALWPTFRVEENATFQSEVVKTECFFLIQAQIP